MLHQDQPHDYWLSKNDNLQHSCATTMNQYPDHYWRNQLQEQSFSLNHLQQTSSWQNQLQQPINCQNDSQQPTNYNPISQQEQQPHQPTNWQNQLQQCTIYNTNSQQKPQTYHYWPNFENNSLLAPQDSDKTEINQVQPTKQV